MSRTTRARPTRSSCTASRSPAAPPVCPAPVAALLLCCLAAGAAGCRDRPGDGPSAESASPAQAAEAVALVDGRPIRAADVARQAAAAQVSPREALDQLVEAELLWGEARRRGLERSTEVREVVAAALVRRFLALTFEREVTPETAVTDDDLRKAYQRNAGELDRPEMRQVVHVLVPFDNAAEPEPARKQVLRARAEEVARRAATVRSGAEMMALAPALSDGDITLKAEQIATGPVGYTVAQFARPVFELPHEGAVSGVVETRFGFHVIYLERIVPPRHIPLEQVAPELRAGLWPELRKREFARFIDGLAAGHRIELSPEALDEGSAP